MNTSWRPYQSEVAYDALLQAYLNVIRCRRMIWLVRSGDKGFKQVSDVGMSVGEKFVASQWYRDTYGSSGITVFAGICYIEHELCNLAGVYL